LRISITNNWIYFFQACLQQLIILVLTSITWAGDLPLIVIDPGHGGKNTGATGYHQSSEKKITLTLASRIAKQLKGQCEVLLTRKTDSHIPLLERTSMANNAQPMAFISLHVGASFRLYPKGVRTYYWQSGQGESFYEHSITETESDNHPLLWDHLQRYHLNSSKSLAQCVHNSILSHVNLYNRKIVGAPLFVLAGADMPAILIEIANITRPKSEKRLLHTPFLDKIARGITHGIDQFIKKNAYNLKTDLHY